MNPGSNDNVPGITKYLLYPCRSDRDGPGEPISQIGLPGKQGVLDPPDTLPNSELKRFCSDNVQRLVNLG